MMTRRAMPILASAAIALTVTGCGWMGGSKEQQTSERPVVSGSVAGTANLSSSSEDKTPPAQQYPRPGTELRQAPPQQSMAVTTPSHGREDVRNVQQQLERRGYELGAVDGIYGPRTAQALTAFQRDENLRANGKIDNQTLAALGVDDSGQQVGEAPAATGTEPTTEPGPREQLGELPGTTGGTDQPQQPGSLPDTGSEAPGMAQPQERSGGIQGNEPASETPMGGTPETTR